MNEALTPDEQVIAALRRIVRAIDLHSRHLVERFSVTGPQLVALQELARLGRVPVGVLARNVHVSHPTMTGILARLEKRGLVQRLRDTEDRRRVTANVTALGVELLEAAPSPLQDHFRSEFARLEPWEQTQMLSTLQRIATMMDAEELEASPVLTTGTAVAPTGPEGESSEASDEAQQERHGDSSGSANIESYSRG
jgi:DNA-binding MarR family transcriptional regulator